MQTVTNMHTNSDNDYFTPTSTIFTNNSTTATTNKWSNNFDERPHHGRNPRSANGPN